MKINEMLKEAFGESFVIKNKTSMNKRINYRSLCESSAALTKYKYINKLYQQQVSQYITVKKSLGESDNTILASIKRGLKSGVHSVIKLIKSIITWIVEHIKALSNKFMKLKLVTKATEKAYNNINESKLPEKITGIKAGYYRREEIYSKSKGIFGDDKHFNEVTLPTFKDQADNEYDKDFTYELKGMVEKDNLEYMSKEKKKQDEYQTNQPDYYSKTEFLSLVNDFVEKPLYKILSNDLKTFYEVKRMFENKLRELEKNKDNDSDEINGIKAQILHVTTDLNIYNNIYGFIADVEIAHGKSLLNILK